MLPTLDESLIQSDTQPHCGMCGRFARAVRDPSTGERLGWRLACVGWDSYMGGWEHD